jgi:steroid delta-isomerase-like uncharacterized protein
VSVEHNKQVVKHYAEAFNRGDFEAIAKLCTQDVIIYGVLGKGGLDIAIPIWQELHTGLAMQLAIEELVAEGDTVAVLFNESGTFRGEFRGMSPTGRSYKIVAMEWFRFRDGKIAARWGARDSGTILRQINGE